MLRAGQAVVGVWNEAFDLDGVPPDDGFFAYAFLFVRNPYARMESEYRYLRSQGRLRLALPFARARIETEQRHLVA